MTIQEWGLTSEDLDALLEGDRVNRSAITRLLRRLVEEQGTAAKYAEAVLKRRRVVQCPRPGYYVICTLQALDPSYLPARVLLESHQNGVAEKVVGSVQRLRLPDYFMKVYRTAALGHDRGKADSRWQRYIKGTKTDEGVLAKPLEHIPNVTIGRRWRKAGLPSGWRHEERSVRFYERLEPKPSDPEELTLWELTRHLILTHHGHFAPVPRLYEDPTGVKIQWDGCEVEPSSSGIRNDLVQSYVKLQRIFGYWGLCFLEAIFRAGDWAESAESSERDKS
jgi:CRISPR-associated endonuclease/helicase Cas3